MACDLKSTAWLAIPVMAAMFAARDSARAACRFLASLVVTVVVLIAFLDPAVLFRRSAAAALVQNSVLFPLGLTRDKTPAESLLPGHLLTTMGTAGHLASVGLLLAAGLAVAISLVIPTAPGRTGGDLATGDRPVADLPARPERALRVLSLPVRPARLAGPDSGDQVGPGRGP